MTQDRPAGPFVFISGSRIAKCGGNHSNPASGLAPLWRPAPKVATTVGTHQIFLTAKRPPSIPRSRGGDPAGGDPRHLASQN